MEELKKPFDILIGGIQIKNRGTGTLGCIVYDQETNQPLGLTNRHILGYKKDTYVNQPASSSELFKRNKIGKVLRKGGLGKKNDFGVFTIDTDNFKINEVNSFYDITGRLAEFVEPEKGMLLTKVGQKTGRTYGIISSINKKKKYITIKPNPNKTSDEISEGGDSGAIWITDEKNFKAVALHRAGEKENSENDIAFAIPISRVLNKMNVKLVKD